MTGCCAGAALSPLPLAVGFADRGRQAFPAKGQAMSISGCAGPAVSAAAPQLCTLRPHRVQTDERAVPLKLYFRRRRARRGPWATARHSLGPASARSVCVRAFVSLAGQDRPQGTTTSDPPAGTARGFSARFLFPRSCEIAADVGRPVRPPHSCRRGRTRFPAREGRRFPVSLKMGAERPPEPRLWAGRGRGVLRGATKDDSEGSRDLPGLAVPPAGHHEPPWRRG